MDALANIYNDALGKYFETLKYSGYLNLDKVNKLLVLHILEFILSDLDVFVTEDDYRCIYKSISCLSPDCLIDLPDCKSFDDLIHKSKTPFNQSYAPRVSEETVLRGAYDVLRIKA